MEREGAKSSDPLAASYDIQEAASRRGFDWPDVEGVLDKLREELDEVRAALDAGDAAQAKRELGDVLFAAVNLGRFLHTHPSLELQRANERFMERFERLEFELANEGRRMESCTLAELDAVWERVKEHCSKTGY